MLNILVKTVNARLNISVVTKNNLKLLNVEEILLLNYNA